MLQISQKTFLWGGLVALAITAVVLFTLHERAMDPTRSGDWWAVRFVTPTESTNLSFEIENYRPVTDGGYELYADGILREQHPFTLTGRVTRLTPEFQTTTKTRVKLIIKLGDQEQSLFR